MYEQLTTLLVLGGFSVVLLAGICLAVLTFILPIWSIIDVAIDEVTKEKKSLWIVLILVLSPLCLGQLLYGIFVTRSKALRSCSLATILVAVVGIVVGLTSYASYQVHQSETAPLRREEAAKRKLEKIKKLSESFNPDTAEPQSVNTFTALSIVQRGHFSPDVSLADFDQNGVIAGTAVPVDHNIRQIVVDTEKGDVYGITAHDFGILSEDRKSLEKIQPDPSMPRLSGCGGIVFIPERREILLTTNSGKGEIYSFLVDSKTWNHLGSMQNLDILAFTRDKTRDSFFAIDDPVVTDHGYLKSLVQMSASGAVVKRIPLKPAIPTLSPKHFLNFQLKESNGNLVLLINQRTVNPDESMLAGTGMFVINPETGVVLKAH